MRYGYLALALVTSCCQALQSGNNLRNNVCLNPLSAISTLEQLCWPFDLSDTIAANAILTENITSQSAKHHKSYQFENSIHLWTSDPICIPEPSTDTNICVFTDNNFAKGRGISLVATPSSASSVAKHKIFQNPTFAEEANSPPNPKFKVLPLAGRGLGLIANQSIEIGERIFAQTPVMAVQAWVEKTLPVKDLIFLYQVAVQQLPEATKNLFLELHGHFGGNEIYDRFETNAFNIYDYAGVFPETARLNHDCRPNAHFYFDKATFTHHVNAVRRIEPGEEITISYVSHYLNSTERHQRIAQQWGFICTCNLCSSSPETKDLSDARLRSIQELETILDNVSPSRRASPADAEKLIQLYKQEALDAPLAKAYTYAALEHSYAGNKMKAQMYADLAVNTALLWKGPGSRQVTDMQELLMRPEAHSSWLLPTVLRQRKGMGHV